MRKQTRDEEEIRVEELDGSDGVVLVASLMDKKESSD